MGAQLFPATNQRRRRLENADLVGIAESMARSSSTLQRACTKILPRLCHVIQRGPHSSNTLDGLRPKFEELTCLDRACTHHSWNREPE